MTTEGIAATATVISTAVLTAAAIFAWRQLKAYREGTEAQLRPYVVVDLDLTDLPLMRLYVQNIGKTMARNVSISFDPRLESTLDKNEESALADLGLFTRPIPTLAPGKRYETLFDVGFDRAGSDLGSRYEVTVSYSGDPRGLGKKIKDYRDDQVIDLSVLWGLQYTETKSVKDIHKVLQELQRTIKNWSAGITRGSGIVVKTPENLRREHERFRQAREERRPAQQSEGLEEE